MNTNRNQHQIIDHVSKYFILFSSLARLNTPYLLHTIFIIISFTITLNTGTLINVSPRIGIVAASH